MPRTKKQTTRIALLADVHGNLPALEAVLADAQVRTYDQVWHLGDFLGYVPFPNEVIDVLRALPALCVIGNYDRKVLAFSQKQAQWKKSKARIKYQAFKWNAAHLGARQRKYLSQLPERLERKVGGQRIVLNHGSPESLKEHLTSNTPTDRLRQLAATVGADIIVCGHSHESFKRRVANTWFINPGSVGRPEGDDARASYCLLEIGPGLLHMQRRRVVYDVARAGRAIHAAGLHRKLYEALCEGRAART
ncbi:metallophosphoesterase family protein [Planctomycetota bacterium]